LKPKQTPELQKPKVRAFLTALRPPFKNFYKGEDPESNKLSVKNIWNKQSGDLSGKLKRNERAQYITIWILFVLFIASLCIFIPLIIIYSGGTESTVKSYLSNIKPDDRDELLKDYIKKANVDSKPPRLLMRKLAFENKSLEPIIPDLSASIAGITSFSRLPEKYRNNSEIKSVMNNPALKNVFYGVDYAPKNVLYPMCGVSLHDVILDVALLSQVTSRIRTYETQCNQAKLILDSIKSLNLNVSLALGVWIGRDENINLHQINEMKEVLRSYPRQYFESLYIGNEVLFREEQTPSQLSTYIKEAKSFVTQELKWNLPVGTSDLGSKANLEVMEASDFFGSNAHPFLNGDNVQNATKWVYDFVNNNVELVKNKAMKKKPPGSNIDLIISEVGWPYDGGVFNGAVAGRGQMQSFLNDWICKSKQKNIPWFYFEAFDEPWKSIYHREDAKWETEWGIFTADRHLKDGIVFPDC
jgi:exo-beta-1,3-glucanase (GH17 family)